VGTTRERAFARRGDDHVQSGGATLDFESLALSDARLQFVLVLLAFGFFGFRSFNRAQLVGVLTGVFAFDLGEFGTFVPTRRGRGAGSGDRGKREHSDQGQAQDPHAFHQ
jgi:hypothetical protein